MLEFLKTRNFLQDDFRFIDSKDYNNFHLLTKCFFIKHPLIIYYNLLILRIFII